MSPEAKIGENYPIRYQEREKGKIEGVKIIERETYVSDDGIFVEIARLDQWGRLEALPELKARQINHSTLVSGTRKAWHLHQKQNEIFFIPPESQLIVGLLDLRKGSETEREVMRLVLGGGKAHLVFIPKGVAHGLSNPYPETMNMFYIAGTQYDRKEPDELRLDYDYLVGPDFWEISKG